MSVSNSIDLEEKCIMMDFLLLEASVCEDFGQTTICNSTSNFFSFEDSDEADCLVGESHKSSLLCLDSDDFHGMEPVQSHNNEDQCQKWQKLKSELLEENDNTNIWIPEVGMGFENSDSASPCCFLAFQEKSDFLVPGDCNQCDPFNSSGLSQTILCSVRSTSLSVERSPEKDRTNFSNSTAEEHETSADIGVWYMKDDWNFPGLGSPNERCLSASANLGLYIADEKSWGGSAESGEIYSDQLLLGARRHFFNLTGRSADGAMEVFHRNRISTETFIYSLCLLERLVHHTKSAKDTSNSFPSLTRRNHKGASLFTSDMTATRICAALMLLSAKFHEDITYKIESFCAACEEPLTSGRTLPPAVKFFQSGTLRQCEWRMAQELGYDLWVQKEDYDECVDAVMRAGLRSPSENTSKIHW